MRIQQLITLSLLVTAQIFGAVTAPTPPQTKVDTDLASTPVTGKSTTVAAGADLQAAINNAQPGDELVLQAGAKWTGNYHLPNKGTSTAWITIRSSAMPKLPPPGNRVAPTDAASMPTIFAYGVGVAFQLDPQAHNYRLMGLEITETPKQSLNYGLIMAGDPNDVNAADLPNHIIIDRCYIHGQKLSHIKFGWQMNGMYLAIIDSYVAEFHGLGQDTQAITGYMGQGPLKIVNNFLEGAGENVLFGGAYDAIPNTTTADVTFTGNFLYKPQEWYTGSLVPSPTALTATAGTGGSLPAATYYYSIIAAGTLGTLDGLPGQAQSGRSVESSAAMATAGGLVNLAWQESTYGDAADTRLADNYIICRTTDPPGGNRTWTYYGYTPTKATGPLTFKDDGTATALSGFGEWARSWSVKNLFEIKNGDRWLVDGNVMDGNWVSSQNGFSVLFTPRNDQKDDAQTVIMQGNHVANITFTHNIVRNVAGGINIGSEDDTIQTKWDSSKIVTTGILVANNVWEIDSKWGGNGIFMQWGAGSDPTLPGVQNLTFDHNTIFQTWNNAGLGPADPAHPENKIGPFQFSNNILQNGAYGWHWNGLGSDYATVTAQFSTPPDLHNNVWAGAPTNAQYPTNNMFPASFTNVGFVNYNNGNGGDYHLASNSPYRAKASDGTDPGADITTLATLSATAISGQTATATTATTPPPTTTTQTQTPPPVVTTPTIWYQIINTNSGKCLVAQQDMTLAQYTCNQNDTAQLFSLIPAFDSNQKLTGYQILNYSGNSLDVWTGSGTNGTTIGLYKFKGSNNELFQIKGNGKGQLTITANNSGSCFDIGGLSKVDGTKLEEWGCNGGANQSWTINLATIQ